MLLFSSQPFGVTVLDMNLLSLIKPKTTSIVSGEPVIPF